MFVSVPLGGGFEGDRRGFRGRQLAPDNRTYNTLLRSLRAMGERGFALLTGRWHVLRHTTASPRSVGDILRAALVLTHFEYATYPILVEITSLCGPPGRR